MIIESIEMQNFLSIGKAFLKIPSTGLVLVTGWDEDLNRANGAGKSAIFQALCWCLFGEFPRDIKVDEIVMRGQTSCFVTVTFSQGGQRYEVTRRRPSGIEVSIDGEKQKGNPKYIQAVIEQAIGFTYDQFLFTSYFPQKGDSSRFIKQNDTKAKDFLGVILSFSKIEQAYKRLHLEIKDMESESVKFTNEVSSLEASLYRLQDIMNVPLPPLPPSSDVYAVKNEMSIIDAKMKIPPNTTDVDAQINQIKSKEQAISNAKAESINYRSSIAASESNLRTLEGGTWKVSKLSCPSCNATLVSKAGTLHVHDSVQEEQVRREKIEVERDNIKKNQDLLQKIATILSLEKQLRDKLDVLLQKRAEIRQEYEVLATQKEALKVKLSSYARMIEAHKGTLSQKEKIANEVELIKSTLLTSKLSLEKLQKELQVLAAAKHVFSPTGLIAYSLESVVADLNDEVTKYLDVFSHNTMTYRLITDIERAKLTHTVNYLGEDVSVGSLSGGEERGLILSVDLGLADVLSKRSGRPLPSVFMLDECFEGLDYVGKEKVIDSLRVIARDRCIVVIDHSTEFNALFDASIKVVKKDKISKVQVV
jgi:DNA repair exonuclease SbcCD ATPase subunit